MKDRIGDRQRLIHVLEALDEIQAYTSNIEILDFLENSMVRFACMKQIEIIGEAANKITPGTNQNFQIWDGAK
jgi:uncharacterized protein with HEPN domain